MDNRKTKHTQEKVWSYCPSRAHTLSCQWVEAETNNPKSILDCNPVFDVPFLCSRKVCEERSGVLRHWDKLPKGSIGILGQEKTKMYDFITNTPLL